MKLLGLFATLLMVSLDPREFVRSIAYLCIPARATKARLTELRSAPSHWYVVQMGLGLVVWSS